jgi:DNA-directed RNA polymerase specialized sigma24 family protein
MVIDIPPLTRNGYERLPDVDAGIRESLSTSHRNLIARARVRDKNHARFLKEETLVFLIRDAHLKGDTHSRDELSKVLIHRIVGHIKSWLRAIGLRYADAVDEAAQEVIVRLFCGSPNRDGDREGGILDLESDKSDFAQTRFWDFLKKRVGDVGRVGINRGRAERTVEITRIAGHDDGEDELPFAAFEPLDSWDDLSSWKTLTEAHDEEAIRAAVRELPNKPFPLREVTRLRYFNGWEIGYGDTQGVTLASQFQRSPKTITTWLQKAAERLRDILLAQ